MVSERTQFLNSMIGRPWEANAKGPNAFDCWHCAKYVKKEVFGEDMPDIEVPSDPSWRWMIDTFKAHDENNNWVEQLQPNNGLLSARDGSLVLMARLTQPAHVGVLFMPEKHVLHCDNVHGVRFDDMLTLKVNGWTKLRYYYRVTDHAS